MSDVTLSQAVRSTLLSLQNTSKLIDRTQIRLSTGLRVASAKDDPISFFQAKTLTDRAVTFTEKKDGIDQGISSLSTALEGVEAIENIVRQLKGVSTSLKSATGTQFSDLITQYNSLRTQIGTLADDTTFQGVNLINSTTETLSVSFSDKTASLLTVTSVNIRESGLLINDVGVGAGTTFNFSADAAFLFSAGGANIVLTYQGTQQTISTAAITISYGTLSVSLNVGTGTGDVSGLVISAGDVITVNTGTALTNAGGFATNATGFQGVIATGSASFVIAADNTIYLASGNAGQVDTAIAELDSALTTLRSNAQTLGSNVALLQTRLDFTELYVDELDGGAAKLTLADINEEGANLLALQTRQQLGISALAFAGQAEQGILALFR